MKRRHQTRLSPARAAGNWFTTVADCLASFQREQIGTEYPVVDSEIVPGPGGGPENATLWLICRSRPDKIGYLDSDFPHAVATIRRKLIDAGIPDPAVASIIIRATSREEFLGF